MLTICCYRDDINGEKGKFKQGLFRIYYLMVEYDLRSGFIAFGMRRTENGNEILNG